MKKKWELDYDYKWSAEALIEVDPETEEPTAAVLVLMHQAVEFWSDGEELLGEACGDVVEVFLKNLVGALIRLEGDVARLGEQEGWFPLNGSQGITVTCEGPLEIDRDDITIRESDEVVE